MEDDNEFDDDEEEGGEEEELPLDPDNPEHEFPIIERDFNKTMAEMEINPACATFIDDFTKLFDSMAKYYENQKRLESEQQTLINQMIEKDDKIEAAMKLSDHDRQTIETLRYDIDRAYKLADKAHSREQNAQEIIDNLRKQVDSLNAELALKNRTQETEEDAVESAKKDDLQRQRDKLLYDVGQLQTKLTNALGYQEDLERKNSEADLKINEIHGQLEDQINELEQQKKTNEKTLSDLNNMRFKLEDRDSQINDLNMIIQFHLKQISKLEADVKEKKNLYEKVSRELEIMALKQSKLQDDYQITNLDLEETKRNFSMKLSELKTIELEATRLNADLIKMTKAKEMLEKKVQRISLDLEEMVEDRKKLRLRTAILEKDIDESKRFAEQDKRALDTATKEKDLLNKQIVKHQTINLEQEKLIKIQMYSKKKLESELDNFYAEITKHKKTITGLERERERTDEEQLNLQKKIEDHVDEIRQKKGSIFSLKKTMVEQENKLRQQQNLFEAIRADRNSLQKLLQESSAESGELRTKLKIVIHQVEQLKEDISMKEKVLIKEENIMRKIVKEKENLKIELDTSSNIIKGLKAEIKDQKDEEKRLHQSLMENDRIIREQAKNLEQLMNERDIIGSQLVRRNDEIALLNEKIRILEITLSGGETQYDQRLEDIRLLKIEIRRLRQEKNVFSKSVKNMIDFRQEIFRLERDLTKYRLKCRALEEELQNPLNIHRWRKLEGTDPQVLDLIQKVQILQKRVLQQASQAVERERHLKEAERLYLNLKQVVSRQPGPAIHDQLLRTQRALQLRTTKLKVLVSELNMAEQQNLAFKTNFQKVTDELNEMKRKYLKQKRQHRSGRLADISSRELNKTSSSATTGTDAKFTGGGFRMSVPTK